MSLMWDVDNRREPVSRLSAAEAFRLGWSLVGPVALLNAFFWILEASFGLSQGAALAMQAANVAVVVLWELPQGIGRALQAQFRQFHLAVSRREVQDLRRTLSYVERLRLSVRIAIYTGGLAVLPLVWFRPLLTAGQNPGQLIVSGILALAALSLPVWTATVLMMDLSDAFSLRIVRNGAGGQAAL